LRFSRVSHLCSDVDALYLIAILDVPVCNANSRILQGCHGVSRKLIYWSRRVNFLEGPLTSVLRSARFLPLAAFGCGVIHGLVPRRETVTLAVCIFQIALLFYPGVIFFWSPPGATRRPVSRAFTVQPKTPSAGGSVISASRPALFLPKPHGGKQT
jgi:hypothetical protein